MKLFTPLVVFVSITVAGMAGVLLLVDPDSRGQALLSLAFLPLAGGLMYGLARKTSTAAGARRSLIRIRAAMVGAGAVLVSGLGFDLAAFFGVETGNGERTIIGSILVLVVILGDLQAGRMDSKADTIGDEE
jgi:hypothetical protein